MNENPLAQYIHPSMNPQSQNMIAGNPAANAGANVVGFNQARANMMQQAGGMPPPPGPAASALANAPVGTSGAVPMVPKGPFRLGSGMRSTIAQLLNPQSPPPMAPIVPPPVDTSWIRDLNMRGLTATASPTQQPMGAAPRGYAEGGEVPEQGMQGMGGEEADPNIDPQLVARIQQIFADNIDNPKAIADLLLQLIHSVIRNALSDEQREALQTEEGQRYLSRELKKITADLMGQLGGAQGAGNMGEPGSVSPMAAMGGGMGGMGGPGG